MSYSDVRLPPSRLANIESYVENQDVEVELNVFHSSSSESLSVCDTFTNLGARRRSVAEGWRNHAAGVRRE